MTPYPEETLAPWSLAASVAALLALDPEGTGVVVRSAAGPAREAWLALAQASFPAGRPWRRVPLHVADHRLLGGLDLTATLRAGRPVGERGLLVEADGTVIVLAMAERIEASMAARIAAVLDTGAVALERDGITARSETRFGVIALDEGSDEEERMARSLGDRLAFCIDLRSLRAADCPGPLAGAADIAAARARLPAVQVDEDSIGALCAAAAALGIGSLRVPSQALRVACAAAALDGRERISAEDTALAAALVFAHRATRLPAPPPEDAGPKSPDEPAEAPREPAEPPAAEAQAPSPAPSPPASGAPPDAADEPERAEREGLKEQALQEQVIAAAAAAIPADLLARLTLGGALRAGRNGGGGGRADAWRASRRRGRPAGVRRGELRQGARLNVIETLRAAAPWQPLRRAAAPAAAPAAPRIEVRRDDFRITSYRERTQTTTIFAVDASGSSALHRLGEVKGAVELLLADCYVRRDQVALIAFRGRGAELLLPPTRSLVRAKRSLAGLPGGGGTPLASGLDAALGLADATRRRGEVALIVLLTDGRGNVARDGRPGREGAQTDALAAARALRAAGHAALLVDTSPQPQAKAAQLAAAMNARYIALPYADATRLSSAIRAASPARP